MSLGQLCAYLLILSIQLFGQLCDFLIVLDFQLGVLAIDFPMPVDCGLVFVHDMDLCLASTFKSFQRLLSLCEDLFEGVLS
jgi:hypothetical protein